MKSFHYNQDPIYSLAASILQGHLNEEVTFEVGQRVKVVGDVVGRGLKGTVDSGGKNFVVVDIVGKGKKSFQASDLKLIESAI